MKKIYLLIFHTNLANIFNESRQHEVAIKYYKRALFINPFDEQSKHMSASLRGVTTDRAPKAYIKDLFDDYAARFETHLVGELKYNLPNLTRDFYDKIFQDSVRLLFIVTSFVKSAKNSVECGKNL